MSPARSRGQRASMRAIVEIHFRGSWRVRFGPWGLYQRLRWWFRKPNPREQDLGVLGICVANAVIHALAHAKIRHHFVDVDMHYISDSLRSDEFDEGELCVNVRVETEANTKSIQALLETTFTNDSMVNQLLPRHARINLSALARPSAGAQM